MINTTLELLITDEPDTNSLFTIGLDWDSRTNLPGCYTGEADRADC